MIYERYHTRDMTQLGGLWNRLPILAFFLILAALGSAAVPGLNGFVGEFPILAGMFEASARTAVLAATGMVLGACYLLWMLRSVVFGPLREPAHEAVAGGSSLAVHAPEHDVVAPIGWHEIAGMTPLLALIVLIGVMPGPILNQIRPAVARINDNVQAQLALADRDRQTAKEFPSASPEPKGRGRRLQERRWRHEKGGGSSKKGRASKKGRP